jgi:putative oxidoreductase
VATNPVFTFFRTSPSLAPVFLRLALVTIFLYHGGQKAFGWFGGEGFVESLRLLSDVSSLGIPVLLAAVAIVVEVAVVPLLFFGIFTRLAALGATAVVAGAIHFIHAGRPFSELEFPLLTLASCVSLVFSGGGLFSLDRRISGHLLPQVGPYSY